MTSYYMMFCDYKKSKPETYKGIYILKVNGDGADQVLGRNTGRFVNDYNDIIHEYQGTFNEKLSISESVYAYINDFNDQGHEEIKIMEQGQIRLLTVNSKV